MNYLAVWILFGMVCSSWAFGGFDDDDDDSYDDDDSDRGKDRDRGRNRDMGPYGLYGVLDKIGYGYKGKGIPFKPGGNPFAAEAMYGNPNNFVGGGNLHLGHGGVKSPLNFITNAALQGNFKYMKNFGYGGFKGLDNKGADDVNEWRHKEKLHEIDPDDLNEDGEVDHLTAVKHKIDDFIAKQWKLGKRKLTVKVSYGNIPLEYQYLHQFHGFPIPIQGTELGAMYGLTDRVNTFDDPSQPGFNAYNAKKGYGQHGEPHFDHGMQHGDQFQQGGPGPMQGGPGQMQGGQGPMQGPGQMQGGQGPMQGPGQMQGQMQGGPGQMQGGQGPMQGQMQGGQGQMGSSQGVGMSGQQGMGQAGSMGGGMGQAGSMGGGMGGAGMGGGHTR